MAYDPKKVCTVKLLMLGASGVGKTAILERFTRDTFNAAYITTIGLDFRLKTVRLNNGYTVSAQIWDTAGQERYRAIGTSFYHGAHGVLLVYDVNSMDSFTELTEVWVPELLAIVGNGVKLILVGNKCDLNFREVDTDFAKDWAEERGMAFYETSAKEDHNITTVYNRIITLASQPLIKKMEDEKKKTEGKTVAVAVDVDDDKPRGFWSWFCGFW